jgi:hypothetical protein
VNKEDIIKLAREAGLAYGSDDKPLGSVTRFSALVAEYEREACAKVCDGWTNADGDRCAEAIRARGQA